jgi:ADP-ribosylglycohydrolase
MNPVNFKSRTAGYRLVDVLMRVGVCIVGLAGGAWLAAQGIIDPGHPSDWQGQASFTHAMLYAVSGCVVVITAISLAARGGLVHWIVGD